MFVKLGQVASSRTDLLPPELCAELALLRSSVAPAPADAGQGPDRGRAGCAGHRGLRPVRVEADGLGLDRPGLRRSAARRHRGRGEGRASRHRRGRRARQRGAAPAGQRPRAPHHPRPHPEAHRAGRRVHPRHPRRARLQPRGGQRSLPRRRHAGRQRRAPAPRLRRPLHRPGAGRGAGERGVDHRGRHAAGPGPRPGGAGCDPAAGHPRARLRRGDLPRRPAPREHPGGARRHHRADRPRCRRPTRPSPAPGVHRAAGRGHDR